MIQLYRFSAKGLVKITKNPLKELKKNPRGRFWLDLQGVSKEELHEVAKILKLHKLAIKTMISSTKRARLEEFPNHLAIAVHAIELRAKKRHFLLKELDIILGKNFIVSYHKEELESIKELAKRLEDKTYDNLSPGILLYHLLDLLIENYHPHLERFDKRLDATEDRLFRDPDKAAFQNIDQLKKEITRLRKKLSPQKEVFSALSHHSKIPENERLYLRDLYGRLLHVMETLDTFHEIVVDFMNGYLSLVSNKMNEVMKVLTIFATIMLPLTFITGIYGMNFKNMPELHWEQGYFIIIGIMLLLVIVMLLFFRRKNWL